MFVYVALFISSIVMANMAGRVVVDPTKTKSEKLSALLWLGFVCIVTNILIIGLYCAFEWEGI